VAFTVVYDANVLFPAPLRDLLLEMANAGEFRARYTAEILDEVFQHLAAKRPDLTQAQLDRTRDLMERAVPDVLIADHMELVPSLELPDADDRHVLAAAIVAGADVIVTNDKKGFSTDALEPYGIEAQQADVFVHHILDLRPGVVLGALQRMSDRLGNPPKTVEEIVDTLENNGLRQTALAAREILGSS
jgi:predicted nucleic acid-binding protein